MLHRILVSAFLAFLACVLAAFPCSSAQTPRPNAPRAFVTGTVTLDGKALEGARVGLYIGYTSGTCMLVDGFPMRSFNKPHAEAVTGTDGRFSVSTPHKAKFFVRVSFGGHPDTELGPLDLDPSKPPPEAPNEPTIELTKSGRIEGRVLVPDGLAKQGLVVVASRGDFFPAATTTDAEGRFVFEGLTPGQYLVKFADRPIDEHTSVLEPSRIVVTQMPTNCQVTVGGTSKVEVDTRNRTQLAGRIAVDKIPATGWTVMMRSLDTPQPVRNTTLDGSGSFHLAGEAQGTYTLGIVGKLRGDTTVRFDAKVKVDKAETAWEQAITTGRLKGHSQNPNYRLLHLTWQPDTDFVGNIFVRPSATGDFVVPALPAGSYKVSNSRFGEESDLELFVVKAGEETILNLR